MSSETLYLKIDKNVLVRQKPVRIRDVAGIACSREQVANRVKALPLPSDRIRGPGRYVFSALDVVEAIHREFPGLEICCLGEPDFILTVEKGSRPPQLLAWGKTALVCLLSFFGAAFSIMAFNNDVGVAELFGRLYGTFTGQTSDGFTVLEFSYSVGVGLGILIFFNHFGRKRKVAEPSPLEVEMRMYEDETDTAMIQSAARKGEAS